MQHRRTVEISVGAEALRYFTSPPVEVRTLAVRFRGVDRSVAILDFLGASSHYSGSFGLQWTKYRDVQIDRLNGTSASHKHLMMFLQGDPAVLDGTVCLEIGSGAGRFTDYLVDMCRAVITVEPSPALFANVALGAPNLIGCRADLFDLPLRRGQIDVVFCRGVIQHTPDPRRAIAKLFEYTRPGGTVLFDVYPLKWYTPFMTKYWLRPFTRRVDPETFASWAERWVPRLSKFKSRVVNRVLPENSFGVNLANQVVPIADFSRSTELRSCEQQVQWSVLDTVDMYTPRYDRPMSFKAVIKTLEGLGARTIRANGTTFCFRAIVP